VRRFPPLVLAAAASALLVLAVAGYGQDADGALPPRPIPTPSPPPGPPPTPTPSPTARSYSDGEPVVFTSPRGSLLLATLAVLAAVSAIVWFRLVMGGVDAPPRWPLWQRLDQGARIMFDGRGGWPLPPNTPPVIGRLVCTARGFSCTCGDTDCAMPLGLTKGSTKGFFACEQDRKRGLTGGKAAHQLVAEEANHGMGR